MKNIVDRGLGLVFIVILIATAGSCSLMKSREPAEAAVKQFHALYNDERFREIYSQADDEFKRVASEEEFLKLLEAVRRKLGTVNHVEPIQWNVNATNSGTFVTLAYNVEFSEGKGSEQFVFRMNGDKALLYNYNVNSPVLVIK